MNTVLKICDKCGKQGGSTPVSAEKCGLCGGNLINTNILTEELIIIKNISSDNSFLDAMIELKKNDIIEFNLKMSQFKSQVAQEQTAKMQASNKPKCPTCNSTNLKRISTTSKVASVAMWGLLSQKAKKTWHCNSCGYEW